MASMLLLLLISPTLFADQGNDPLAQYRVLEWQELIPENWEAPLVSEAYDDTEKPMVDDKSVVAINQQLAALPGFIKPKKFDGNRITELLLVPFLPHHTRQHAHLEANQMVYVYLHTPITIENPFEPFWVVGTLNQEPVMTDEGPAAYRFVGAVTTNYEY